MRFAIFVMNNYIKYLCAALIQGYIATILNFAQVKMDDNVENGWNAWVCLVGVVSRRWVWLVGVGGNYG